MEFYLVDKEKLKRLLETNGYELIVENVVNLDGNLIAIWKNDNGEKFLAVNY